MMESVKDVMSSLGTSSSLARKIGCGTSDFAKRVGSGTADLAKRVGGGTAVLAKRVGPKRGVLGLVLLGAAIGGTVYAVRYFRTRREELSEEAVDLEEIGGSKPRRRRARASKRKNHHPQAAQ
jgi:hypothetical protein